MERLGGTADCAVQDVIRREPEERTREDWWRGAVIYQVYPRSFQDSNADGIGDLPGLIQRLPYIAGLGVDALWICPFYLSPQRDFGYDIADHCAVDPSMGTLEDFDRLLARAHQLGLKVLVDLVWGHTSDQHPWFAASRSGRNNPRAEWYTWADPAPDGTAPNNWLSVFGGSAWSWEPRRRQFYLHHFLSSQPRLNLAHPPVVEALLEVARFWLDRGVDGFRLDALDFLTYDPALRSNPPAPRPEGAPVPVKLFGLQRHEHDMTQPETLPLLARLRRLMADYPGTTTLGEVSSQPGAFERVARYTAGRDHLHMAYTLQPLRGLLDREAALDLVRASAAASAEGWPAFSFSNHDAERVASRWCRGADGTIDRGKLRLVMTLLLTLRGTACLYQGEELGLPQAELAQEALRDPFGIAYWPEFAGRDGARTPLPWDAAARHGGFSEAAATWLPQGAAAVASIVEQLAAADSMLADSRALLAFRRRHATLATGSLLPLELPEPLIGYLRGADERIAVVLNLGDHPAALPDGWRADLPPLADAPAWAAPPGDGVLPPYGVLLAAV